MVDSAPEDSVDAPSPMDLSDVGHDVVADVVNDVVADAVSDDAPDAGVSTTGARPISPQSGARVWSRRPTFRWTLGAGYSGARVEVCANRDCTSITATFDATGETGAPATDLSAGPTYWRVRGIRGGTVDGEVSATWSFDSLATVASSGSTWGIGTDFDGDGYPDAPVVTISSPGTLASSWIDVYAGGSAGVQAMPGTTIQDLSDTGPSEMHIPSLVPAGDVDGDGFVDAIGTRSGLPGRTYLFHGGPGGLSLVRADVGTFPAEASSSGTVDQYYGIGDANGDGYADAAIALSGPSAVDLFLGSAGGLSSIASQRFAIGELPRDVRGGDANGDGVSDLLIAHGASIGIYLGGSTGFPPTASQTITVSPNVGNVRTGDFNGDSRMDFVVTTSGSPGYVFLGGVAGYSSTPDVTLNAPTGLGAGFAGRAVGDVNADGYDDVILSAPVYHSTGTEQSEIYIFAGSASGPITTAETIDNPAPGFGSYVGCLDTNRDGRAEIFVTLLEFPTRVGHVLVFDGSARGAATALVELNRVHMNYDGFGIFAF